MSITARRGPCSRNDVAGFHACLITFGVPKDEIVDLSDISGSRLAARCRSPFTSGTRQSSACPREATNASNRGRGYK
jgi:hypothetical protein